MPATFQVATLLATSTPFSHMVINIAFVMLLSPCYNLKFSGYEYFYFFEFEH
ncbi:hypothetical protein Xkoz_02737 [Xenorhabdus kozodoii]|uniref:Uncharacterized protein n=1 Tax=Xenorhabdus kozodoii TaxID=351676 RepID=A0A2D0L2F0_9GAMM|nr:hypothetical protein Xkoz_03313 [Xenorhabdus kozodoii]PHM71342.1 hypothetical protein Xkoz_02737 [Xenorhabdus kozodoii]